MDIFTVQEYENLLSFYKENNFVVSNFKDLHNKYKNNEELPSKFVLLRHDVHLRDIPNAYKMIELEEKYYGKNISTFFVQWNFIGATEYEEDYEKKGAPEYEKFIIYCLDHNIDVQPHYSLFCDSYKCLYGGLDSNISFIENDDVDLCIKSNTENSNK